MSDLGIRLLLWKTNEANPNNKLGDYGTTVYVPNYIPQENGMDQFTIDETQALLQFHMI
jgi:hypothetical protein